MIHASPSSVGMTNPRRPRTSTTVAMVLLLLLECLSLSNLCDASSAASVGSRARVARAAAVVSAGKDNVGGSNSNTGGLPLNGGSGGGMGSHLMLHPPAPGGLLMAKQPGHVTHAKKSRKGRVPYFVGHLFDRPAHHQQQRGYAHPSPQDRRGGAVSASFDREAERGGGSETFEGSALTAVHESDSSSTEDLLAQTTPSSQSSSLWTTGDSVEYGSEPSNQGVACHRPSVAIENSECNYDAVEEINQDLTRQLKGIVSQKFFKFYKLNLYGTCPFWTENHFCTNKDCSVALIDEKHIPEEWRSKALGAISSPQSGMQFQPFKSCNLKDQDFCQVDDEANGEGVYVDLVMNPERFTGYSGPSAAKVWGAIYNENCFNVAHRMQMAADCEQCQLDREAAAAAAAAEAEAQRVSAEEQQQQAQKGNGMLSLAGSRPLSGPSSSASGYYGIANVFGKAAGVGTGSPPPAPFALGATSQDDEDMCLEKRVFYRMISGLHASISIHICDEYFNQTTGVWSPNLECFVNRVGAHPDRMENLFFDYSMLLRAVSKLSRYLKDYAFCTGNPKEDMQVKSMVDKFIETAKRAPASFDEKAMFVGPAAQQLKTEFRDHYRNITRIMDCVGCEKCRLWGKVQTSGLATALKVLFSYNDEFFFSSSPVNHPDLLQRTEIVALFNTLNRFSESIESIARFRRLYLEEYGYPEPAYWTHTPPTPSESEQLEPVEDDLDEEAALQLAMEEKQDEQDEDLNHTGGVGGTHVEEPVFSILTKEEEEEEANAAVHENESQQVAVEYGHAEGSKSNEKENTDPTDRTVLQQEQPQEQPQSAMPNMLLWVREQVVLRLYHFCSWFIF